MVAVVLVRTVVYAISPVKTAVSTACPHQYELNSLNLLSTSVSMCVVCCRWEGSTPVRTVVYAI